MIGIGCFEIGAGLFEFLIGGLISSCIFGSDGFETLIEVVFFVTIGHYML